MLFVQLHLFDDFGLSRERSNRKLDWILKTHCFPFYYFSWKRYGNGCLCLVLQERIFFVLCLYCWILKIIFNHFVNWSGFCKMWIRKIRLLLKWYVTWRNNWRGARRVPLHLTIVRVCQYFEVPQIDKKMGDTKAYDIVIFGATGFTGQFVVDEVARVAEEEGGLTWAVAGRTMAKLQKVLEESSQRTGNTCLFFSPHPVSLDSF